MKFRKKAVVIEAFQMTLTRRWDNSEWPTWLNQAWNREPSEGAMWIDDKDPERALLFVGTLEGVHRVDWDDWIIQGIKGELYPCKPDIFEMTYNPEGEPSGAELIAKERLRQVSLEDWTPEHDDQHKKHELVLAAIAYAAPPDICISRTSFSYVLGDVWPEEWDPEYDKRNKHSYERRLEIAGALIAAELDRLKRAQS